MIKFVPFARNGRSLIWINPTAVMAVTEDEDGSALIWLIDETPSVKVALSAADAVADLEEGSAT